MNDKTETAKGDAPAGMDLTQLLAQGVDAIKTRFGDMSDVELATLRLLDSKSDSPRSTLDSAIEAEQSLRADHAAAAEQQRVTAAVAEAEKAQANRVAQLEADLAKVTRERDSAVAALEKAGNGPRPPRQRKADKPRALRFDAKADADKATTVVFADELDQSIPSLPELSFGDGDFASAPHDGRQLRREVAFDADTPRSTVAAAFLVDDAGKVAGVSRLKQPIAVGGGTRALMPARSLMFRPPAEDARAAR